MEKITLWKRFNEYNTVYPTTKILLAFNSYFSKIAKACNIILPLKNISPVAFVQTNIMRSSNIEYTYCLFGTDQKDWDINDNPVYFIDDHIIVCYKFNSYGTNEFDSSFDIRYVASIIKDALITFGICGYGARYITVAYIHDRFNIEKGEVMDDIIENDIGKDDGIIEFLNNYTSDSETDVNKALDEIKCFFD